MRRYLLLSIATFLFPTLGVQAQDARSASDERELRRIEMETGRMEQQDNPAIADYLSDDWVCVGLKALGKREFLENVRTNAATHRFSTSPSSGAPAEAYAIEKQDLQVRLFGDTAVVTYVKIYRQSLDALKFFHEDDTDVFTRDAGGWHLRFTKIMPVPVQSASN